MRLIRLLFFIVGIAVILYMTSEGTPNAIAGNAVVPTSSPGPSGAEAGGGYLAAMIFLVIALYASFMKDNLHQDSETE